MALSFPQSHTGRSTTANVPGTTAGVTTAVPADVVELTPVALALVPPPVPTPVPARVTPDDELEVPPFTAAPVTLTALFAAARLPTTPPMTAAMMASIRRGRATVSHLERRLGVYDSLSG